MSGLDHYLPNNILREVILPYTYCPQPSCLINDIHSYHYTINYVHQRYKTVFNGLFKPLSANEGTTWLNNDLVQFLNKDIQTIHRYDEFYLMVYQRLCGDNGSEWLSNDICRFLNDDEPTMNGYNVFYLMVYQRLYMNRIKNVATMTAWVHSMDPILFPRDIKIVIGLLTTDERSELITFLNSISPGS